MAADAFADGVRLAPIAAAKTFAGEAAGAGAAIAHQMHGAIGFSREYALQLRTRRLWSWRDEHGNEAEWSAWLGTMLCTRGADALWAAITEIG
jgi:alkylation response protein AidB-like acyl-CoA dehydrogenase